MDTISVAPGIRRLTTPLPFRPRTVHAYLVELDGGGLLLVDGGANRDDAWTALDAGVRGAGGWERIAAQVVTHMHVDHVGLTARVRAAAPGVPLLMGRLDAERSAHAAAHPDEESAYRERLLRESGAAADLMGWAIASAGGSTADFVLADHLLPEGVAPLPGADGWSAVWTPGHTAGHISLFRSDDRVLISGDAVLPRITPTIGVNRQREDPVGDYLGALDRVAGLSPSLVLPGHGEPIREPDERIRELRDDTRAETDRVASLLSADPASAAEIALARYAGRDLPAGPRVQAIRETLAHLDHLQRLGRARSESRSGVVRFWQNQNGGPEAV